MGLHTGPQSLYSLPFMQGSGVATVVTAVVVATAERDDVGVIEM